MKQTWPNGASTNMAYGVASPDNDNTLFSPGTDNAGTSDGWSPTPSGTYTKFRGQVVADDGILTNFYVKIVSVTAGATTFQVMVNGVASALAISAASGDTEGMDSSHTVSVSAGDRVGVINDGSSPTVIQTRFSVDFTSSTVAQAVLGTNSPGGITASAGTFFNSIYSSIPWQLTESRMRFVCPMAGTINSFYVWTKRSTGSTSQQVFSIFVNGVENTTTKITYASSDFGVKSVASLGISFSPGDTLSLSAVNTGLFANDTEAGWGIMYTPTVSAQYMIGGLTDANLSTVNGTEQFGYMNGSKDLTITEDTFLQVFNGEVTLSNFYVLLDTAPGASQTREFRVRKNSASGNSIVTISGTSVSGTDGSNTDVFVKGDYITFFTKPTTATATASKGRWSAVLVAKPDSKILARPMYFR